MFVTFVSSERPIWSQTLNKLFQPTQGAVYLGRVQRLMTHIIIIIERVSFPFGS